MKKIIFVICIICFIGLCGCNKTITHKDEQLVEETTLSKDEAANDKDGMLNEKDDKGKLIDSVSIDGEIFTYIIDSYEKETSDRYARILIKTGSEEVTELIIEATEWGEVLPEMPNIIIEKDVNFDGTSDVLINLGLFGEYSDKRYKCYLRNGLELKYCKGFENINNPEIYNDSCMIIGHLNGDVEKVTYKKYQIIQDSLQITAAIDMKREDEYNIHDEIFFDIMFESEQADIRTAYEQIVNTYEKIYPLSCCYNLICLNNDDIPEFVVSVDGCFVSVYTFHEGKIYSLINQWTYGAGGNHGYEYLQKKGIIRNVDSDYAGLVMQYSYFEMSAAYDISVKYILIEAFEDEEGNIAEYDAKSNEVIKKYYYCVPEISETLITEEEFDVCAIDGDYIFLKGKYSKEEIEEVLSDIEIENRTNVIDVGKYNISDENLKKSIQECVQLKEGTEIDFVEWVDEEKKCMRVSIRYIQQPENLWYNHVEDYFFFVKEDETEILYVDYSNDGKLIREVWENPDFNAHFEDVNFDGQADLIISLGVNGAAYGEQYCAYLYTEEGYEYCPSFEYLCRYSVDYINKQIVSTTYEDTADGRVEVISYYIFKDNAFQKLEKER